MGIVKAIKFFIAKNFLISLGYHICSLHAKTITIIPEGIEKVQDHIAKGGTVVFPCWHQRFLTGFWVPRIFGMSPCIMISQSRDGDFNLLETSQRRKCAALIFSSVQGHTTGKKKNRAV